MPLEQLGRVHAAHAGELAVLAAGGDYFLVGLGDAGVVELAGDAHLEAEVVGADAGGVDAGGGGDLVAVRDAGGGFDHHYHQRLFVHHSRDVADGHGLVADLGEAAAHGALADGRQAAGVGDALSFLFGFHVRNHDSLGAVVEDAR